MHPEVVLDSPGECPKCGVTLEPQQVGEAPAENPGLKDMTRRFWVSLVLALPVLALAMGGMVPGVDMQAVMSHAVRNWLEFALATPVVLWAD